MSTSSQASTDPHGVEFRKQHEWFFLPKDELLAQGWHHQKPKEGKMRMFTYGECIYSHYGNPRGWHTSKYHGGTVVQSYQVIDFLSENWNIDNLKGIIEKSLYWPHDEFSLDPSKNRIFSALLHNALLLFTMQALLPDRAYDAYLYLSEKQ